MNEIMTVSYTHLRVPEENSLFCNWSTSWWKIRDEILEKMEKNNFKQGDLFNNFKGVEKK